MTALLEYYSATALLEYAYVSSVIVQIAADPAPISL